MYEVTAPCVVIPDLDGNRLYRYAGATIDPYEVDSAALLRLIDREMVQAVEVEVAEEVEPDAGQSAGGLDFGTGDTVLGGGAPDNQAGDGTPNADTAAPARPRSTTSPKEEWISYAVSRGVSAEEAAGMTRAELAARLPEA